MTKGNKQDAGKVRELTPEKVFKPIPSMVVWLEAALQIADDSPHEVSRACKDIFDVELNRTNWYYWSKQEGFNEWWITNWEKGISRWKTKVDSLGWKFAKRGSDKHFEYLAKRVGNVTDTPGVVQQFNNYNQLTDEQLESVIASKVREVGATKDAPREGEKDQTESS